MSHFTVLSRNFPCLFDCFYSTVDVSKARPGYLVDTMFIEGGVMLWCGRHHLVIEVHALRATSRVLRRFWAGSRQPV